MTLSSLLLGVAVVAAILTGIVYALREKSWINFHNLPMSYLQNFVGALFIFSGGVKAIDPLGTAYKLEQYFGEFETTFNGTWFSFISGIFPVMSDNALTLSVIVITFEIILAIMLLIGYRKKFTAWAFFLLMVFFTFLTGYTYLTGYVPNEGIVNLSNEAGDVLTVLEGNVEEKVSEGWAAKDTITPNFFKFSTWGSYVETNMKVTDCGCFGDFLKLEPKTSFLKDVFLLIPGILFLLFTGKLHQIFAPRTRMWATLGSTIAVLAFCYYNFGINLPVTDFRPFREGVDVRATKKAEMDAAAAVEVTGYRLRNLKTGKVVELAVDSYLTDIENYPATEGWNRGGVEQIKEEPSVKKTKISEYSIQGEKSITYTYVTILSAEGDTIPDYDYNDYISMDTTGYRTLSTRQETSVETTDLEDDLMADPNYSFMIVAYKLEKSNKSAFKNKINALHKGAEGDGLNFYVVNASSDDYVEKFRHEVQSPYTYYSADDILLKTIIRSNPGVVLWKNGVIVKKWHQKQLPSYEEIKAKYMK